jgi:hypothetical protein
MDKTPRHNKMATPPAANEPAPCPQCGRPLSAFGCRPVPAGQWCLTYGLKEDPRRIISSVAPDPAKALVETDRQVMAAATDLASAEKEYERADREWQRIAMLGIDARNRLVRERQEVMVDGRPVTIWPEGVPDPKALEEQQNTAQMYRDDAHGQVVKARERLAAARRRARSRLTRAAA